MDKIGIRDYLVTIGAIFSSKLGHFRTLVGSSSAKGNVHVLICCFRPPTAPTRAAPAPCTLRAHCDLEMGHLRCPAPSTVHCFVGCTFSEVSPVEPLYTCHEANRSLTFRCSDRTFFLSAHLTPPVLGRTARRRALQSTAG